MATGLLPNLESQEVVHEPLPAVTEATPPPAEQPAYLARIATLPASLPERGEAAPDLNPIAALYRPESARLDQIEHALTILASVVARLAKEAQQSRLQLRSTEYDPDLQEDRRVQRELVRSMQSRLAHIEERMERQNAERASAQVATLSSAEAAERLSASLTSIRNSLAAMAKRRQTDQERQA